MSTVDGGGGGGGTTGYTDERFDQVIAEIKELLGDLTGIETAATQMRDYFARLASGEEERGSQSVHTLTIPATKSYQVYPVLPLEERGPGGVVHTHQAWVNECFELGKLSIFGTGAWLKNLVDNYYLVDTDALISGATRQGDLVLDHGTQLDSDFADVSAALAVHWEGDSKDEFFRWFALAYGVSGALFQYANAAQVCAGACGDAIRATQEAMLHQAEEARDTLKVALQAWRDDADVFPFPPGSGWKFKEIGTALHAKIDEYTDKIPAPDLIVDAATSKAKGKIISKLPGGTQVVATYNVLTKLEQNEKDVRKQPKSTDVIAALETQLRAIAKEGDDTLATLDKKVSDLAAEVADADILVLPRLPRSPDGTYTA